jgi:ABC-type transporter Mla subunit MlaD
MDGFPLEEKGRLLTVIGREAEAYSRLRDITQKQGGTLADGDYDALDGLIAGRQVIIDEINGLHQEFGALMQSYVSFAGVQGAKRIAEIDDATGDLQNIIKLCMELNDAVIAALEGKAEENMRQIGKLSMARKSLGKYMHVIPSDPELFDRKT